MPAAKPVLALVHGWGMNARVFDALAAALADVFDVHALDLPGHGGRPPPPRRHGAARAARPCRTTR